MRSHDKKKNNFEFSYPNGWLIKAYRNLSVPPKDQQQARELYEHMYQEKRQRQEQAEKGMAGTPFFTGSREVVYGNYDRIQITPVDHLHDFTWEANQMHDWLGSNQSILLFKWRNDKNRRCFQSIVEKGTRKAKIGIVDSNGNVQKNEFFAATFCYISDDLKSRRVNTSYSDMLDRCERQVHALVDAFNQRLSFSKKVGDDQLHHNVSAEVFGSMSAAEIVILWSARQYTDLMYLVDCVRDFQYKWGKDSVNLFRTTYTMIAFPDSVRRNNVKTWEEMRDSTLNEILGDAFLQFATQDGAGEGTFSPFESFFTDCMQNASEMLYAEPPNDLEWSRCAGEYDLVVKVMSKYVTRLFCNPQIWHEQNDSDWIENPRIHDATCSIYHPIFSRYILYSFTRLSYQKDRDLPSFARGNDLDWEKVCEQLKYICDEPLKESSPQKHMSLIKGIGEDKKKLETLLNTIQTHLPIVSNLSTELNQLFSDYMQCMCASADGLWIEDYQELFRQMLDQLTRQIRQIDVWKHYPEQPDEKEFEEYWEAAREVVQDISKLIRSLHLQTNHISTSNKLFFREQETHFGYSAQHDLVLHAYYDIVKQLMEVIYGYSDKSFQSTLYPLVNFQAGDHIESDIYYEEHAELFLKTGSVLWPRIMVIQVPMDGMDNLMYYIPMMIHEVFHYAAPWDRRSRNQMLAKIAIYMTLENSFAEIFCGLFCTFLDQEEKHKPADERRTEQQLKRANATAEKTFREHIRSVLHNYINDYAGTIYQSIESTFFNHESVGFTGVALGEAQNKQILRNWFLTWLKNWIEGFSLYSEAENGKGQKTIGLSDLFKTLFQTLSDKIPVEVRQKCTDSADGIVYNQVVDRIKEQIDQVLNDECKLSDDNKPINQQLMMEVQNYTASTRYSDLLIQLDEVFPDIAMVTLTEMPASGYMLQIAMDLDKQMYACDSKLANDVRFASVLHWLIDSKSAESEKPAGDILEQELVHFAKMYHASYELVAFSSDIRDEGLTRRAERWSSAFRRTYYEYTVNSPSSHIQDWINMLIQEQMIPCVNLDDDAKANIVRLFETPYHAYLRILREEEIQAKALGELFQLSIQTILQFQRYQPLKSLNQSFQSKIPSARTPSSAETIEWKKYPTYVAPLMSEEYYYQVIQLALRKLYDYRKAENLTTSTGMWYRGVSNADNNVLPSGFVHFAEDAGLLNGGLNADSEYTYLDAQRHNYESFRYSAEGSNPDISPAQYQCAFNYLTLMQHYSQHTNLLDWSEDFFAATYFVVESQIELNDCYPYDQMKKTQNRSLKDVDKDGALYILDPVRFNLACQTIENEMDGLFNPSGTIDGVTKGIIPNLSIPENQRLMPEYHDLYVSCAVKTQRILTLSKTSRKKKSDEPVTLIDIKDNRNPTDKLTIHLPRAVYAAKLNARIRAQSGLFVAFSMLSNPVVWEGQPISTDKLNPYLFHYQALEQIQDYYLKMSKENNPFLIKIRIPSSIKPALGKMFYHFGLSKERIYPELQNNRNR